ncbi:hypothetical protein HAP48_0035245 [Bradyrhizobium septentrionale]|uniref:Uncharacterized protein n=1 Tax=Bradyrhizobium septentrionale TaxID=1404411 RepID=A0A974A1I5_9BRAD|nr:hypothetical protein [Bradyrhizobium septentrionale]UGY13791.1 hypothetical protein HAP48_0035245 [Bradyrhizobium septentrionale]
MASKVEIIDTTDVVPISPLTPRALRRAIVDEVAIAHGVDPGLIENGNRTQQVVDARAEVARRLRAMGMSEQRVADVMHIQLKTARTYLGTLTARRPYAPRYDFFAFKTGDNDATDC